MAAARSFSFICGQDDYLVGRAGRQAFDALAGEAADEFSREIINGFAANVGEVETAVQRFRETVQTVPMFGGKRVVWLKDVNFLADSPTGRAEGTQRALEDMQEILQHIDPAETGILITASPVDRRRSFPRWCERNSDFTLVGGDAAETAETAAAILAGEAQGLGAQFGPGALDLLIARVGPNPRLLVEETRKLATFAAPVDSGSEPSEPVHITEADVAELTPNVAQGDFFETADAFFAGNLKRTLEALHRHFFAGGDARPVLAALQNRNRLLIQLRTLLDAGDLRLGARGVEGLKAAGAAHAERFGEAGGEKSSYNLFTQNPWYLGKLAAGGRLPALRRLVDNQQEFVRTFEEVIRRPREQEEVLRELAVRCLAE